MIQSNLEQKYVYFMKAQNAIQAHCKWLDCAIVKKRSKKNLKIEKLNKATFICDRDDNKFKKSKFSTKSSKRATKTIKCDCLWRITIVYLIVTNYWILIINEKAHNHDDAKISAHSTHRRAKMNIEMMRFIKEKTVKNELLLLLFVWFELTSL